MDQMDQILSKLSPRKLNQSNPEQAVGDLDSL